MIKILIIHKSPMSNGAYLERFLDKYPILKNKENWSVVVRKFSDSTEKIKKRAFDRLYFDDETVKLEQLAEYVNAAGNPQTFGVNLKPKQERKKKDNRARTVHPITNLEEI